MVTPKDILTVLVAKLRTELPGIVVEAREVKEGYRRGSIYIFFENLKISNYMKKYRETTLNVELLYFPKKEDDTLELLNLQDKLVKIFSDTPTLKLIDGLYTEILEVDAGISDGILQFDFDIYLFEEYPEKVKEFIENIIIGGLEDGDN